MLTPPTASWANSPSASPSSSWASTSPYSIPVVRLLLSGLLCSCISYMSTVDCGDYVVVTNARKVKVTGKKADQIIYRHHTMYPGNLKEIKYKDMMKRKPDEVRCGLTSSRFSQKICAPRVDYPKGSLRHAAQKQAARPETGEAADIRGR